MDGDILSVVIISAELQGIAPVDASLNEELIISSTAMGGITDTLNGEVVISLDADGVRVDVGTISKEIIISLDADGVRGSTGDISSEIIVLTDGDADRGAIGDIAASLIISCSAIVDTGYKASGVLPITILANAVGGRRNVIRATVVITSNITDNIIPIIIDPYISGNRGVVSTVNAQVRINSNSTGETYTAGTVYPRRGNIAPPVLITSNILGGITNTINSNVIIGATATAARGLPAMVIISAQMYGQDGYFEISIDGRDMRPVISTMAFGRYGFLHTGTIAAPITFTPAATGNIAVRGTIEKSITISATAEGSSTAIESLYGTVNVTASALGIVRVTSTLDKPIIISSNISAQTQIKRGTINRPIIISSNIVSRAVVNGKIGTESFPTPIVISAQLGPNPSRARSFLSPGVPVPQSLRLLQINSTVIIGCVATTTDQPQQGIIDAQVVIAPSVANRARVLGFAGTIASPVIIVSRAYDADYGVSVPKAVADIVLQENIFGINLPKSNVQAVVQQPPRLIASKSVAYAVIASGEAINPGYQAILFF